MKFLLLDADHSLSAIGGASDIVRMTGYPEVPINRGIEQVNSLMKKLLVQKVVKVSHPLFGETEEIVYEPTPMAQKEELKGLALDTISVSFDQTLHRMTAPLKAGDPPRQLEMKDWGVISRFGMDFLLTMQKSPFWFIVNCHMGREKDGQSGIMFWGPQIKGSTAEQLNKFFDVVLYARVKSGKNGSAVYYWQTRPDPQRDAKDRMGVLDAEMAQDYSVVFQKYVEKGVTAPKILVIGESGCGKTTAFKTIPPTNILPQESK